MLFVCSRHVGVEMVQSLVPSGVTGYMLVESGEDSLQVGVVEVTSNNNYSLRMIILMFTNCSMEIFHSQLGISIWGSVI